MDKIIVIHQTLDFQKWVPTLYGWVDWVDYWTWTIIFEQNHCY